MDGDRSSCLRSDVDGFDMSNRTGSALEHHLRIWGHQSRVGRWGVDRLGRLTRTKLRNIIPVPTTPGHLL